MQNLLVSGIDEAGRGPLAGPLSVAGVVLPPEFDKNEINDSKKLTHEKRALIAEKIKNNALTYSILLIDPEEIDHLNILQATLYGMKKVATQIEKNINELNTNAKIHHLVDGNKLFCNKMSCEAIIKGDSRLKCIGAASILAKVERDNLMEKMAEKYPEFDFEKHKGYPTKVHKEKIKEFGPCPIHRKSFSGVKEYLHVNYKGAW